MQRRKSAPLSSEQPGRVRAARTTGPPSVRRPISP